MKEAISSQLKGAMVRELLEKIADCPEDMDIQMCGGKTVRSKRAPSAYNIFVGDCIRAKDIKGFGAAAPAMKGCAAEWKAKKEAQRN